jgi:hypothetical protein
MRVLRSIGWETRYPKRLWSCVLEERINDRVTVLIDSYFPEPSESTTSDSRSRARGTLAGNLDALLGAFPELVVEWFIEKVAKPLTPEEKPIELRF